MEFDSVIEKRHSVRAFKKKPASWKDVVEAIDSARHIPLAGNNNTLKYLITQDSKKIDKLAKHADQLWIGETSIVVLVCSDESMIEKMYGERGRVYSRQQAGAAIQTLILKLVDLGLSACWVGAYDDKKVREMFEIPENIQIEAIIPVGYEKAKPAAKRKKSLDRMMFWEKWDQDRIPDFFQEPATITDEGEAHN